MLAIAVSRPHSLTAPPWAALLLHRTRGLSLSKHAKDLAATNPDLQKIVNEFEIPGKFQQYLFPSKRQLKRQTKLTAPSSPEPWKSPSSSLMLDPSFMTPKPSKRLSHRISRAIHDILYDPAFGIADQGDDSFSWRVDKIHVSTSGAITVWWVPIDDVRAAMMLDNEYHVEQLSTIAKTVKSALQARLKIKRSQLPKITFLRKDTSLDLLIDIVAEEMNMSTTDHDSRSDEPQHPPSQTESEVPVLSLFGNHTLFSR